MKARIKATKKQSYLYSPYFEVSFDIVDQCLVLCYGVGECWDLNA